MPKSETPESRGAGVVDTGAPKFSVPYWLLSAGVRDEQILIRWGGCSCSLFPAPCL